MDSNSFKSLFFFSFFSSWLFIPSFPRFSSSYRACAEARCAMLRLPRLRFAALRSRSGLLRQRPGCGIHPCRRTTIDGLNGFNTNKNKDLRDGLWHGVYLT